MPEMGLEYRIDARHIEYTTLQWIKHHVIDFINNPDELKNGNFALIKVDAPIDAIGYGIGYGIELYEDGVENIKSLRNMGCPYDPNLSKLIVDTCIGIGLAMSKFASHTNLPEHIEHLTGAKASIDDNEFKLVFIEWFPGNDDHNGLRSDYRIDHLPFCWDYD